MRLQRFPGRARRKSSAIRAHLYDPFIDIFGESLRLCVEMWVCLLFALSSRTLAFALPQAKATDECIAIASSASRRQSLEVFDVTTAEHHVSGSRAAISRSTTSAAAHSSAEAFESTAPT